MSLHCRAHRRRHNWQARLARMPAAETHGVETPTICHQLYSTIGRCTCMRLQSLYIQRGCLSGHLSLEPQCTAMKQHTMALGSQSNRQLALTKMYRLLVPLGISDGCLRKHLSTSSETHYLRHCTTQQLADTSILQAVSYS
jgi:hypothetical protein